MSNVLRNAIVSLVTGLAVPILAMAISALLDGGYLLPGDLWYALIIFGPFTLVGSFLVVWPTYALQRRERSELRKIAVVLIVSAIAGVLLVLPLSERFPWEGAAFAIATASLWLVFHRLSGDASRKSKQELQSG